MNVSENERSRSFLAGGFFLILEVDCVCKSEVGSFISCYLLMIVVLQPPQPRQQLF